MAKIEITRIPFIKNALKCRYPQMAVFIVMLAGYIFAILAGLIGTPVGSHNFSIVFVWIAWWAVLILVAVPFFGRGINTMVKCIKSFTQARHCGFGHCSNRNEIGRAHV